MTSFKEYQQRATSTNKYQSDKGTLAILALGLTGEAGEVADKIKKFYRDLNGEDMPFNVAYEIAKELGDVLWYLSQISDEIGFSLEDIATINQAKLKDREQRNKISGSGDNR